MMQLMRGAPKNRTSIVTEADRPAVRALAPEEAIEVSGGYLIVEFPPPGGVLQGPIIVRPWNPTPPGTMHPD
jgi:hypothetical protein